LHSSSLHPHEYFTCLDKYRFLDEEEVADEGVLLPIGSNVEGVLDVDDVDGVIILRFGSPFN
jgi:hypothetical protein